MKIFYLCASLIYASPHWGQTHTDYMERGQYYFERFLKVHGQWDRTFTPNMLLARCVDCEKDITVSISIQEFDNHMTGLSKRLAFLRAQRKAYCHGLVSRGEGRCIEWVGDNATRVLFAPEGDVFITEASLMYGS